MIDGVERDLVKTRIKELKEDIIFYDRKMKDLKGKINPSEMWEAGFYEGEIFKSKQTIGFLETIIEEGI